MLSVSVAFGSRPPKSRAGHDRRGDKLQHDANQQGGVIVAAPPPDDADQSGAQRADGATDRGRQAHDDDKAGGAEFAMNDQRRQGNEIADRKTEDGGSS